MYAANYQGSLPTIEFPNVRPLVTPKLLHQAAPIPGTAGFTTAHWVAWGLGASTMLVLVGAVVFGRRD